MVLLSTHTVNLDMTKMLELLIHFLCRDMGVGMGICMQRMGEGNGNGTKWNGNGNSAEIEFFHQWGISFFYRYLSGLSILDICSLIFIALA